MTLPVRAVIMALSDDGQVQTVTVQAADGAMHSGVEVAQPFGLASVPPGDGGVTHLLVLAGDPANLVALPAGCPAVRFGTLAPGETAIYGSDGSRVHIRAGGIVEVKAATQVIVEAASATVTLTGAATITAPGGVTVNGNVTVEGNLLVSGDISDLNGAHDSVGTLRDAYNAHLHPDPQGGDTGSTTIPVP